MKLSKSINTANKGYIVIEPVRRKVYKLDELLGGITGKNLHQPVAMGASVGKEVW